MARVSRAPVTFFAIDADHPVLVSHRNAGGRAAFTRNGSIVLAEGGTEIVLVSLADVPLTHGGRISFQVENALASAAAAWALGVPREVIRTGLKSFAAEMEVLPGRFNLLEISGATVVVDYGHNVSSLIALIDAIEQFPHERRTIVYSAAGDRRDTDMVRQGELLGHSFDRVVLYEDHYMRGRTQGDIMRLFQQGLSTGRRAREIHEFQGNIRAIEHALTQVRPGELLVLQADKVDETMEFLNRHLAANTSAREIDLSEALEGPHGDASVYYSARAVN